MKELESKVLAELKRSKEPKKKRVTFFLNIEVKDALARWCEDKEVPESRAIEEMIKAVVPGKYFKN